MKRQTYRDEIDNIPPSAALHIQRPSRYGSVPGLEDHELADPAELERCIFLRDFAAVLTLPVRRRGRWVSATPDEHGRLDFGAFGTIDFERLVGPFDKARYKADRLQEELENVLLTLDVLRERLPPEECVLVLSQVHRGETDWIEIANPDDKHQFAQRYLRMLRLRREITDLRDRQRERSPFEWRVVD
jgi:hypothetical protein